MDLEFTLVLVIQPGFQTGPYEIAYTNMGYHIIARFQYVGTQSQQITPSSEGLRSQGTSSGYFLDNASGQLLQQSQPIEKSNYKRN